jgi:hypothetical protein
MRVVKCDSDFWAWNILNFPHIHFICFLRMYFKLNRADENCVYIFTSKAKEIMRIYFWIAEKQKIAWSELIIDCAQLRCIECDKCEAWLRLILHLQSVYLFSSFTLTLTEVALLVLLLLLYFLVQEEKNPYLNAIKSRIRTSHHKRKSFTDIIIGLLVLQCWLVFFKRDETTSELFTKSDVS